MKLIVTNLICTRVFQEQNCSDHLQNKYQFSKQNFLSPTTYATLEGKYETIRKMVYYKMHIQRKKKPGRNCEWIKLLSELENSITHHPKINICAENLV